MTTMKLDNRDIVCEQDYSPLSNAELVAAIERYATIMHTAPLIDFDLEWIVGPARALLARVEAAEADRDDAILRAGDAAQREDNAMHALAHFRARVAELEAQLAAQQWRPVTEEWPHYAERVAIGHVAGNWAAIATRVQSPDDDEWELEDGKMLDWESASVAIELPPLPQEPPQ
jgi:hypothetical protein